ESLVVGDGTADDDAGVDVGAGALDAFEDDAAVVDEDAVAGADVAGESLVGRGDPVAVAGDVVDGDGELVTGVEGDGSFSEGAEADLGALEVGEDADAASAGLGCGADVGVVGAVVVVGTVAEVQSRYVQSGVDELAEDLRARRGRSEGRDDLCSTCHV